MFPPTVQMALNFKHFFENFGKIVCCMLAPMEGPYHPPTGNPTSAPEIYINKIYSKISFEKTLKEQLKFKSVFVFLYKWN